MRPGHWDSGEKKHDHKGYQSQRQSFAYTMTHYDLNNDPQNIARQAVEKKVKWAFNGLANMTSYQLDSAGQHFDILRRGLRIATALERQGVSATGILNNFRTYANFLSRMKISDPEVRKKHGSLVELMRKLMPDAFPQEAPSAVPTPQIGANDVW